MMDTRMIAFCGLDCAQCEAYQATQANDEDWKGRIAEKWRVEYNAPNLLVSYISCDGCHASGAGAHLGGHCLECHIRACGVSHGVANCAECAEFEQCETIQGFIQAVPPARANLEAVRASGRAG